MATLYKDDTGSWYGGNGYLTNRQQIFNSKCIVKFFKTMSVYAWSNNSICAIMGNISFESTVNPQAQEVGGSGYGLVQWTPKSNLLKRAKAIGRYNTYDTMYTQLLVIDYEVKKGIQWIQTSEYPISFGEFVEDTTHTIEWLTGAWMKNYERPADQSQQALNERCNGDNSGHIGSMQWNTILDFNTPTQGSIDGFLDWCKYIANDNRYLYALGAGHGVPWDYSGNYFDCSSFISFGLHNGGGYDLETQFSTSTQKNDLSALGFDIIPFRSADQLQRGDILFYNILGSGHTEAVYSVENGVIQLVGAHTDNLPPDEQISIVNYYDSNWQYIARPTDSPTPKPPYYKRNKKMSMVFVYPTHKK